MKHLPLSLPNVSPAAILAGVAIKGSLTASSVLTLAAIGAGLSAAMMAVGSMLGILGQSISRRIRSSFVRSPKIASLPLSSVSALTSPTAEDKRMDNSPYRHPALQKRGADEKLQNEPSTVISISTSSNSAVSSAPQTEATRTSFSPRRAG